MRFAELAALKTAFFQNCPYRHRLEDTGGVAGCARCDPHAEGTLARAANLGETVASEAELLGTQQLNNMCTYNVVTYILLCYG